MKKTDIAKVLKRHERENNVNSEHRIIIAEKDFKQLIDDLFSLTDVGSSLPTKEAMFLQEVVELKKLQKIDPNMNRIDFGAGFVRCYKWLETLTK